MFTSINRGKHSCMCAGSVIIVIQRVENNRKYEKCILEKNCNGDFSFKQSGRQMQCQAHVELECLRALSSPMKVYLIMADFFAL